MAKALGTSRYSDQLSDRERTYLTTLIESGSVDTARRMSHMRVVSPNLAAAIHVAVRRRMAEIAPLALTIIAGLMENGESEKIRLDAARTILDRSGHGAPRATADKSLSELPLNDMAVGDLRALAAHLEAEIAGRAKPVSAADSSPSDSSDAPLPDYLSEFIS